MSDERQETVADIVREMRIGDLCAADTSARQMYINDFLASYADRIEAAAKRESEATAEKSSAVGKVDTVREIAQEMLNTSMQDITAERINGWATRLAAACEQPVTNCNQLGNAAKMREALQEARRFVSASAHRTDRDLLVMDDEKRGVYVLCPKDTFIKIDAALSALPRNCDVGTAEEQSERYEKFCYAHRSREKGCGDCPLCDIVCCGFAWLQMPYESEVK